MVIEAHARRHHAELDMQHKRAAATALEAAVRGRLSRRASAVNAHAAAAAAVGAKRKSPLKSKAKGAGKKPPMGKALAGPKGAATKAATKLEGGAPKKRASSAGAARSKPR